MLLSWSEPFRPVLFAPPLAYTRRDLKKYPALPCFLSAFLLMISTSPPAQGLDVYVEFINNAWYAGDPGIVDADQDYWLNQVIDQDWFEPIPFNDLDIPWFTPAEQTQVENGIISYLETVYADYNIDFIRGTPVNPVDEHIRIGRLIDANAFGLAGVDSGNMNTDGDSIAGTFPFNFGLFIDEFAPTTETRGPNRDNMLTQITNAIAGTTAHELLHEFGANHQHAYGADGITSDNWSNTGGIQNGSLMATGVTGLGVDAAGETGREQQRSLGRWERALLDIAGGGSLDGANPAPDNGVLVDTPITTVYEQGGDAGQTLGTAQALTFADGETSGLKLAYVTGDTDSANDKDWFRVDLAHDGLLTIDAFDDDTAFVTNGADVAIRLLDAAGLTTGFEEDDVRYSDDLYDVNNLVGFTLGQGVFLPNIVLTAGTYYVEVTNQNSAANELYALVVGYEPVPEPASVLVMLAGLPIILRRFRPSAGA